MSGGTEVMKETLQKKREEEEEEDKLRKVSVEETV